MSVGDNKIKKQPALFFVRFCKRNRIIAYIIASLVLTTKEV